MYDPNRKLTTPDFYPNQQMPEWIPMGEDDQSVDLGPAAGAFKQRFMGGPQASAAPEHGVMPEHMAPLAGGNPGHEMLMGGENPVHGMAGGASKPGMMKSL